MAYVKICTQPFSTTFSLTEGISLVGQKNGEEAWKYSEMIVIHKEVGFMWNNICQIAEPIPRPKQNVFTWCKVGPMSDGKPTGLDNSPDENLNYYSLNEEPEKKYSFTDLVDIESLQAFMDSVYKAAGTMHAILDTDNNILSRTGWTDICLKFHRTSPQTENRCRQSDSFIFDHLHKQSYIGYRCCNGLIDYATPIIVEGQHLATIFMGQLLHEPPDEDYFRSQAKEFGFDETAYIEALRKVPIVSVNEVKIIMEFIAHLGSLLATIGLERKRQLEAADQARRVSENKFYTVFRCCPDAIGITTFPEGSFREVNEAFLDGLGYTRDELKGQTTQQLAIWVNDWERQQVVERLSKYGTIHSHETRFRTKDGDILNVLLSADIVNMDGEICLLTVVKDISKHKQMEETLHQFEKDKLDILNSITDGFYALDSNWRFTYINRPALNKVGLQSENVIGKRLEDVFPKTVPLAISKYKLAMEKKIPQAYEYFSPYCQEWLEARVYPTTNGISVYFHSVEDRKNLAKQKLADERLDVLIQSDSVPQGKPMK
jgi:PAS domain S-box-containing protein